MGVEFGNLPIRIRRIAYYGLSPMEQRAWAKAISRGLPSGVNRMLSYVVSVGPALGLMTFLMFWSDRTYKRVNRKNPKTYENDT